MPASRRRVPRATRDTTVYTNAPIRRPKALTTHLCTLLQPRGAARDTIVYTNAQNWRREPRSFHSCTLLRSHGVARDTIVYTNAPIWHPEALTAHLCTLSRLHGAARDTTVYTNAPNRRGEARSSHLCTLFGPRGHPQLNSVYKRPQGTAEKPSRVRYVVSPQLPLEERRNLVERDGVLPAPVVEVGVHRARNDHQLLVLGVVASPRHVGKRVLAEVP